MALRTLDLIYIAFFAIHIPATLLLDLQALYPIAYVPALIAKLPPFYIAFSQDPLIGGAFGAVGEPAHYVWFMSFLLLEAFFQLPVFILGIRGLLRESKKIYVLLLIYAASTATTTLPCLAVVFTTPVSTPELIKARLPAVSDAQRLLLLSSYIPFFIIPLVMTVDMAFRVLDLVKAGARVQDAVKRK